MRLATIAWRGLLARPLRTALAVIGVALGVAVVAATVITTAHPMRRCAAPLPTCSGPPTCGSGRSPRPASRLAPCRRCAPCPRSPWRRRYRNAGSSCTPLPARTRRCSRCWRSGSIRSSMSAFESRASRPVSRSRPTARPTRWLPPRGPRATASSSGDRASSRRTARGDATRCASSGSWRTPDSPRSSVGRCSWCRARRSTTRSWSRRRSATWISTSVRPASRQPSPR